MPEFLEWDHTLFMEARLTIKLESSSSHFKSKDNIGSC